MSRITRAALAVCASAVAVLGGASAAHADQSTSRAALDGPQYVRLQAEYSKNCLAIEKGSLRDVAQAVEAACSTETDNGVFQLRPLGDATFEIMAKHSGRCLSTDGNIDQHWCDGGSWQRWNVMLVEVTTELYELRPVDGPSACLTVGSRRVFPDDVPTAYLHFCVGSSQQRWRLLPAVS
ncbi:RICIN domain-containing protein [Streptomyces sp. NPDC058734]|uniref:RICIN domain-containing protein n=1 Tax=Streptomyces sp. NPDC058734 TaxID=3346615 RepID=UPI0036887FE2